MAAGGGGGGGEGGVISDCTGGAGGDGGEAGQAAFKPEPTLCDSVQAGGAAGLDGEHNLPGGNATDVGGIYIALAGSGGGGGGGGEAGQYNTLPTSFPFNSGGGGGGGGDSLGGTVTTPNHAGNGIVTFNYEIAYPTVTTATATPNPANKGQKVTVTATVDNVEPGPAGLNDPTGTVNFGIAGCAAVALVGGTAGDGLATAKCEYTAGDPSSITCNIVYNPLLGAPFGSSATTLKIDVVAVLAATGLGASSLLPVGGAALVLLLGGALLVLRRRTA